MRNGGAKQDRTADLLRARQALSQLSYSPKSRAILVGLGGFEPPTSPLSGVRSNQLSYRPGFACPDAEVWHNRFGPEGPFALFNQSTK